MKLAPAKMMTFGVERKFLFVIVIVLSYKNSS